MVEKAFCISREEVDRLVSVGFAIVAIATFPSGGGVLYSLERGSAWSRALGSK